MILTVTNGSTTYEISLDSSLRDPHNGKPVSVLMLTKDRAEAMGFNEDSLFRMIDEYWKKHY